MKAALRLSLLLLLCLLPPVAPAASPPVPAWSVLEDPGGQLDLAAVRAAEARFQPVAGQRINRGYSASAWWLRTTLPAGGGAVALEHWLVVAPARLEQVTLWHDAGGAWQALQAGIATPHARWPMDSTVPTFPLLLPPDRPVQLYLRVQSRSAVAVEPVLCRPADCAPAGQRRVWAYAVLVGINLAMVGAALLLAWMHRRPAYLLAAGFSVAYIAYELALRGTLYQYLWPASPEWALRVLSPLAGITLWLLGVFVLVLLGGWRTAPRLAWLLLAVLVVQAGFQVGALLGDYRLFARLTTVTAGPLCLVMLAFSLRARWMGVPASRHVLAGMLLIFAGTALRLADVSGVLPQSLLTILGLPLAVIAFNFVVMDLAGRQVLELQRQRHAAQEALLAERAARQQQLEQQVAERTQALRQALDESRLAQEQRTRLLAYVGHDLRAPLATTLAWTRQLDAAGGGTPEQSRLLAAVERGVGYQLQLIDELIELARGELDELEIVPAPTYVHSLLAELAEHAAGLAGQRGNRFEARIAPELPAVLQIDAKRLRQVLLNLLANAAKFTEGGTIALEAGVAEGRLQLAVADTGPGIGAAEQERLFAPFERGTGSADQPGAGLGLAIARQIVRSMGGELALSSTPGAGSRFSFTLALVPAREHSVLQPAGSAAETEPFGRGRTVLVLDDDDASRERLAEMLYAADFDVLHESNGVHALAGLLATPGRVALVLADQRLPGCTGSGLARALRERLGAAAPPVVLTSAWPAPPDHGCAAALLKPLHAGRTLGLLRQLLAPPGEPPN